MKVWAAALICLLTAGGCRSDDKARWGEWANDSCIFFFAEPGVGISDEEAPPSYIEEELVKAARERAYRPQPQTFQGFTLDVPEKNVEPYIEHLRNECLNAGAAKCAEYRRKPQYRPCHDISFRAENGWSPNLSEDRFSVVTRVFHPATSPRLDPIYIARVRAAARFTAEARGKAERGLVRSKGSPQRLAAQHQVEAFTRRETALRALSAELEAQLGSTSYEVRIRPTSRMQVLWNRLSSKWSRSAFPDRLAALPTEGEG